MYKICKSEHSAARQREMELGLLDMMATHRYEDISVIDLCEYLQVPRKSFYRYFSSKDAALNALLDHTMLEYESYNVVYKSGEHRTLEKEFTQFFMFWSEHRHLLDVLDKNLMSAMLVERMLKPSTVFNLIPSRFLSDECEYEKQQRLLFSISGLMTILLHWHREGYTHCAEEMGAIAAHLVSQPLFPDIASML